MDNKNRKEIKIRSLNKLLKYNIVSLYQIPSLYFYKDLSYFQLKLAQMELNQFFINPLLFYHRSAFCERVGEKYSSHYYFSSIKGNKQRNRENNYLTHSLYLYKAKSIPQNIRALINYAGIPDDGVIFDPFCGSGTICLEAGLMNYKSIGIDVNPFSCILSEIKTNILSIDIETIEKNFPYFMNKY